MERWPKDNFLFCFICELKICPVQTLGLTLNARCVRWPVGLVVWGKLCKDQFEDVLVRIRANHFFIICDILKRSYRIVLVLFFLLNVLLITCISFIYWFSKLLYWFLRHNWRLHKHVLTSWLLCFKHIFYFMFFFPKISILLFAIYTETLKYMYVSTKFSYKNWNCFEEKITGQFLRHFSAGHRTARLSAGLSSYRWWKSSVLVYFRLEINS